MKTGNLFNSLVKRRNDSSELIECMEKTVNQLIVNETSSQKPGILLGKIQSGKTRAYIGIIALCFDYEYDVAIILTKGTKVLMEQTVQRFESDYKEFIENDSIGVYDIMNMPNNLTAWERNQKLVIVVKKEVNNMKRVLEKLGIVYPDLRNKKILIVDDEADFASVSFRKYKDAIEVGKISSQIDELRRIVKDIDYLQVTATPYSLYLQPENDESDQEFLPKRPSFTEIIPTFKSYIGGDFYFYQSEDPNSLASFIYEEVSNNERDVLRARDERKFKLEDILTSNKISVLRRAVINFIVGANIQRIQQKTLNSKVEKYAFIAHSEISRKSHEWQHEIIKALIKRCANEAINNSDIFKKLVKDSYWDIKNSVDLIDVLEMPDFENVYDEVKSSFIQGQIMITVVNSDRDVAELLDFKGQLKLRNPMNIFIGGQILDRGITISNLIGFYYGRSPKHFQQDTVLQHSRMYGARSFMDLATTRFYTTRDIYEVMKKIHDFDSALREAFQRGDHKNGVYFIRKDVTGKLAPCSPNKILLSSLTTLRPYRRLLPIGFQTDYKTNIKNNINQIDNLIEAKFLDINNIDPILVCLEDITKIIKLIEPTLNFEDNLYNWSWNDFYAIIEHLSINASEINERNKVWLLIRKDRNLKRLKLDGGFSDAPDTPKTEGKIARASAVNTPMIMLFRQNGLKENGWNDYPFWWPVLFIQKNVKSTVFANDVRI